MKVTISDEGLDGLMHVRLAETKEVTPGVMLDYAKDKQIAGMKTPYLDKPGERRAEDPTLKAFVEPSTEESEKKAG